MSTAAFPTSVPDCDAASVESLLTRINDATRERQRLRSAGGSAVELERNRLEIVTLQWALSRALIARHGAPELGPSAA